MYVFSCDHSYHNNAGRSFVKILLYWYLHLPFNLSLIGPMSSYTRQNSSSYQVQCRAQRETVFYYALFSSSIYICLSTYPLLVHCRVTLDRTLLRTRSNVELREKQCFIMLFSQAPFTFALQFIPYWSNVELHSTETYFMPGPMSSLERHMVPIFGPL